VDGAHKHHIDRRYRSLQLVNVASHKGVVRGLASAAGETPPSPAMKATRGPEFA
jgi:hypothetical protein